MPPNITITSRPLTYRHIAFPSITLLYLIIHCTVINVQIYYYSWSITGRSGRIWEAFPISHDPVHPAVNGYQVVILSPKRLTTVLSFSLLEHTSDHSSTPTVSHITLPPTNIPFSATCSLSHTSSYNSLAIHPPTHTPDHSYTPAVSYITHLLPQTCPTSPTCPHALSHTPVPPRPARVSRFN